MKPPARSPLPSVVRAEIVDDVPDPVARRPHRGSQILRVCNLYGMAVMPSGIRRQLHFFAARLQQQRTMPSEPAHEESELENDVVAWRGLRLTAALGQVVGLRDGDREVGLIKFAFEAFDWIVGCPKNAVGPDRRP